MAAGAYVGNDKLGFSTDYKVFFSEENKQLRSFENIQTVYGKNDNILIVIESKSGSVFTRESLEYIEDLTAKAWKIPYTQRVDSITNFSHVSTEGDNLTVNDLFDSKEFTENRIDIIKEVAVSEPQLLNRIVSSNGKVSAINVIVNMPGVSPYENSEVVAAVRNMAKNARESNPDFNVYLTGMVMYNNAFLESSIFDSQTIIPVMYVLLSVSLLILLRSFIGALSIVAVVYLATKSGLGLSGWLGFNLSTMSAQSSVIILTIAGAACVHLVVSYLYHLKAEGDKHLAMKISLEENLAPITLTSLTTILGFLSLNMSAVPPIQDLGNIVALGAASAYIFTIALLPSLCLLLTFGNHQKTTVHQFDKLYSFVYKHNQKLVIIIPLLLVTFTFFSAKNELNDEFVKYFGEALEFRQATDFTTNNLTGLYSIHMSIASTPYPSISNPEYLKKIEEISSWLRIQDVVLHVATITDTVKRINRDMHGGDTNYYIIPESTDLVSQYMLFYRNSLPLGMDMANRVNLKDTSTRVSISLKSLSTQGLLDIEHKIKSHMMEYHPQLSYDVASTSLMFAHIGEINVKSMMLGLAMALLAISLVLWLALRSFSMALLSLVTNLLPIAAMYGVWGMLDGQIGISLAIVGCIAIGIVVDDTVHLLYKYIQARRENLSIEQSVSRMYRSVGKAITISSVVLIIGFASLSRSTFSMNSDMGVATSVVIMFALIVDLVLIPSLMIWFFKRPLSAHQARAVAQ
jgi:predicted RND superfamily exporter protein